MGSSGLCCHAALDIVLAFADPRAAQIWSGPGGPRIGTGVAGSGDEEASAAGTCEGMTFGSNDAGSKTWRFMFWQTQVPVVSIQFCALPSLGTVVGCKHIQADAAPGMTLVWGMICSEKIKSSIVKLFSAGYLRPCKTSLTLNNDSRALLQSRGARCEPVAGRSAEDAPDELCAREGTHWNPA